MCKKTPKLSKFMNRMNICLNLLILSLIFQNFIVFYCIGFLCYSLLFPRYWYFKNCHKKCLYKIYLIFLLIHKGSFYIDLLSSAVVTCIISISLFMCTVMLPLNDGGMFISYFPYLWLHIFFPADFGLDYTVLTK